MDDESIACFGGSIHQLGRDMRYNGELSGVFSICQLYILFLLNTKKFCKKKKSEYLMMINNNRLRICEFINCFDDILSLGLLVIPLVEIFVTFNACNNIQYWVFNLVLNSQQPKTRGHVEHLSMLTYLPSYLLHK